MNHPLRVAALLGLALAAAPAPARNYALLVGVTEYKADVTSLKYTANDAEKLAELLVKTRGVAEEDVVVLTNERADAKKDESLRPTAANIRRRLKALTARRGKGDVLWVALAGHGIEADAEKGGVSKTFSMFVPQDYDPAEKVEFDTGKAETLINLHADVIEPLGECGAGLKILLIDACRDNKKVQTRSLTGEGVSVKRGVCVLFSCSKGQFAQEHADLRHGVFFHFALEALGGKAANSRGEVTWGNFSEYVMHEVPRFVLEVVKGGAKQSPHAYSNFSGGLSPVLFTARAAEMPKRPIARAHFREGLDRLYGRGESVDEAAALASFELAAKEGDPRAKAVIAYMLHFSRGLKADPARVAALVEEALPGLRKAGPTDADAANWLGLLLYNGVGVKADPAEAKRWYEAAEKSGDADAMDNLGNVYYDGKAGPRDYTKAAAQYRKAVDRNLPSALVNLADMYHLGHGVKQDHAEAFRLYRLAATRAYPPGMRSVGKSFQFGWGVGKDPARAREWLQGAADKGDSDAMLHLGHMYLTGEGAPRDRAAGLKLVSQAIGRRYPRAMTYLARALVLSEYGLEPDEGRAVELFRDAGERGAERMFHLGLDLNKLKKPDEAFKWHLRSARAGWASAMLEVGRYYALGLGTDKDGKEAIAWFTKPALKDDAEALFRVGWVHESGHGVKKNTSEALKWYRRAAAKGHKTAAQRVELLERST